MLKLKRAQWLFFYLWCLSFGYRAGKTRTRDARLWRPPLYLWATALCLIVQSISLILCLRHDISSREYISDLALLLRGSLHWEVVYPSSRLHRDWVEVSNTLLPSRCIFPPINRGSFRFCGTFIWAFAVQHPWDVSHFSMSGLS